MSLHAGDKITAAVYLSDGSTFVMRARFCQQQAVLYVGAEITAGISSFVLDCDGRDEGIYWIRGWPDIDSEDVTTMLAAFALAGNRESSMLFLHDEDWYDDSYHWLDDDIYWDDKLIPQGLVR
jgi:hypothetical protein